MDGIRRRLIASSAAAAFCPHTLLAQKPERVARVVVADTPPGNEALTKAWAEEFAKHGWVLGRNLQLDFVHITDANPAEARISAADAEARARQVVASRPDAIIMVASPEIFVLKRLTRDIPIVFYNLGNDPVKLG
ncbi:MAG TPA: hypothetical protein VM051_06315, partial [Usitatibacter sp.]|nr:hypothetical protein [Usitatibacter sp.]